MPELGQVLRDHREQAGLTRREVADAIGETENKLYRWETGRNKPSVYAVLQLLMIYGSSPEDIIQATAEPSASPADVEQATLRLKQLADRVAAGRDGRSRRGHRGKSA